MASYELPFTSYKLPFTGPEVEDRLNKVTDLEKNKANHTHDWSNVQNKPFTTVGGDTLTWDGNTDGLESVEGFFYRVSDATPTFEEVAGKTTVTANVGGQKITSLLDEADCIDDGSAIMMLIPTNGNGSSTFGVLITLVDNYEFEGLIIPKKGIYFTKDSFYVESLTINGYTGFTKEVIKQEVLPESLWFGESETGGDTLTWDGNTDGLVVCSEAPFYRISDVVPTKDDFLNGGAVGYAGGTVPVSGEDAQNAFMEDGSASLDFVLIVPTDHYVVEGFGTFPEGGIYFLNDGSTYVSSLTINGYTGFPSVTPLNEKYMPVLTSPSGKKFKITVDDTGALKATEV